MTDGIWTVIPTFALLTLALGALWVGADDTASARRRNLWLVLLLVSVGTALGCGVMQPLGLVWVAGFAAAVWIFSRPATGRGRQLAASVVILGLAAGLMLHRLPGFNNPRVINAVGFTADAIPYTLYLNFDKTVAGLILLGWTQTRIVRGQEWRAMLRVAVPRAIGLMTLIMVLSLAAGYVRWEPKFPPEAWLWLGVNLGFTCLAEEALFRGFIQAQLQRVWKNIPRGSWLALGVAAGLFGLAHAAGGATYVVLAAIAGLGYGWIYQKTQRIEASILTHFALNSVHFFFFTYPALQP